MGLREKIKTAKTEADVTTLLQSGTKYEYASTKTKNAWRTTAKKTLIRLMSSDTPQTEATAVVEKKQKKPKKNT